jgi:HAD superfamily hydrolase (TIGR01509 family)
MIFPRKPMAVVFDMDGLLFDTESLYRKAFLAAAEEGGHDISQIIDLLVGRPWLKSRELLIERYGNSFPVDDFMTAMVRLFNAMAETDLMVMPGAVELLDTLEELKLPAAIATSSAHHTVERHLSAHNMVGRFQKIVANGDYVASKPAPDPFLKAAEQLAVAPQSCLALEDSHNGVRSAAAAGMMTIMVPDLHQPTNEIQKLCVFVANDLHEVRRVILCEAER